MRRREFLAGAAGVALGAAFWQRALLAAGARGRRRPTGRSGAADANGLLLPAGFPSRASSPAPARPFRERTTRGT